MKNASVIIKFTANKQFTGRITGRNKILNLEIKWNISQ